MVGRVVGEVVNRALGAPPRLGRTRLVAIDGPSGSGKSTLADAVAAELRRQGRGVELVRTDDFATWDEPVDWWPRLTAGVLDPVALGRPGRYRPTSWGEPVEEVTVAPVGVVVVEGVSSARAEVHARLSLAVWAELGDRAARLERAVARDGEHEREHLSRWQRFEECWFTDDATRSRAHLVVVSDAL